MNTRARIVVCDDDVDVRDLLIDLLGKDGYDVVAAEDGIALRKLVPRFRPDIVICDLMMPGEDGLSLVRWLRGEGHAAVLMLTAMGSTTDRIVGLEMGADDYLAKPFEPGELRARLKAILRRTMSANLASGRPAARIKVGRCVVDTEMKAMFDEAGERVELTAMEYDLLHTFITHARRPLTRDQLLEFAHHKKWDPFDRSIDMRIARLRKKIEFDPAKPSVLKTVRGEGYMLVPDGE
ncbi:response regulator [Sandarakinorhabdus sp.]|uniref:response regulator n=1 Tax=Sandarakinorhabdus sp. TaxID=1916663 RepID=UPI003341BF3C